MEQPTCPYCGEQAHGEWHSFGSAYVQEPAYCESCRSNEWSWRDETPKQPDEEITGWRRGEFTTPEMVEAVMNSERAVWIRELRAKEAELAAARKRYVDQALF